MLQQLIATAFGTVGRWYPDRGMRPLALAAVVAVAAIASAHGQNPLVAHYNFDDPANTYSTGGTIFDVSGNGFNGTVVNAALTHNATGGISGGSMNAVSSGSASFTTDYTTTSVAADDFTLMFWVKAGAPSSFADFGQINYSNGTSGQLRTTSTNREFYYRHVVTSSNTFVVEASAAGGAVIVDNSGSGSVWKQVAFMANSSTGEFGWYVDGGTPLFTAFPDANNPFTADTTISSLRIGRSNQTNSRTGQIDDVQLYDRSLTQTEVQLLFANPGYGGTNFRAWDPAVTSNSWTAAASDWQGLGTAAAPGVTGDAASTNADVAILKNYAFSGSDGLGIDMSAAGANGSLALGGISFNSASGALRIGNSAADTSGTLRLNGGLVDSVANTILKVAGSSDLTIGNSASGSGSQTMGVELTGATNLIDVAASRTLTIESAIAQSGAGSAIQKTGAGTLVLQADNTFTGGTTISGGTLEVASIADSGPSNLGNSGDLSLRGGTLRYTGTGAQSTTRSLSIDAGTSTIDVTSGTGSLTLSPAGGTRNADFTKAGPGSLVLNAGFTGTAAVTVDAGSLVLGTTGSHSGPTTVATGATLEVAVGDTLRNSTLVTAAGSTVVLSDAPGVGYTLGGLAGAAALDASGRALAIGSNNASTAYSGAITAAAFEKQGTGTLTLVGSNTLGSVDVQGGLLVAASAGAIGNAPITISGGTFRNGVGGLSNPVTLSGAAANITFDFGADAVDYLIVGGGGGGDTAVSGVYGSGGGGGAVIEGFALSLNGTSHAITVGGGGQSGTPPVNGGAAVATAGGESTAFSVTANGGQAGATTAVGRGGASGSGFAGGLRGSTSTQADSGGGGGAGGPGTNPQPSPNRKGGDGGPGISSDITGTVTWYGGGGAGGISYAVGTNGGPTFGGIGGGGGYNQEGLVNTGGGGGAMRNGGSGIVIVRYAGAPAATGGSIDTDSLPGYTLHTFTDVGTSQLEFNPSATLTGEMGGSGGFTLDSVGTLTLSANNSYSGGTIVSRGTLVAGHSAALGSGAVTVNAGGRLRLDQGSVIANEVTDLGSFFFAGTLEFAGGGLARTSTAGGGTLGTLLAGSANLTELLNPAIAWQPQTAATASDIMQLTGTNFVPQVLSLSYAPGLTPAAGQDAYLGWFDPTSTSWVNAIDGNFGGTSSFFEGSWTAYLSENPGATPTSALGVYGHDPATSTVWAVVNHNSDFAVIVVPEPASLALAGLGLALAGAAAFRRRSCTL